MTTTTPSKVVATFGCGCFWCSEAIFKRVRGVTKVTSGYAGGKEKNPTYDQVSAHVTGHAEVVQVEFDPKVVSYEQLLGIFFGTHDPTTRNRQGHDVGAQYRSVILYHDEEQRKTAEAVKAGLEKDGVFGKPIVTEITPYGTFYPAEPEHVDYYAKNPAAAYCQIIIDPKLAKFRQKFAPLLKPEA
jgi:peptide-methionine (S)-S-oxide reductase